MPSSTFSSVAVEVTATSSFIFGEVNVLFVRVSVDIRDTKVELPPVGSVSTSEAPAAVSYTHLTLPTKRIV